MTAYSLTAIILICIALMLLMVGVYRQQKSLIIRSGGLAAVAIMTTLVGLVTQE